MEKETKEKLAQIVVLVNKAMIDPDIDVDVDVDVDYCIP